MRRLAVLGAILYLLGLLVAACDQPSENRGAEADADQKTKGSEPNPQAYFQPGPIDDERWVLPNGRMVWPAGLGTIVDKFAIDLAVSPDGATLAVASAGVDSVQLVDTATMTVKQELEVGQTFTGATWNVAGDRFWIAGGGTHVVYEFEYTGGVAVLVRTIPVLHYPSGLALSPDEARLYVACRYGKRLAVVDLLDGEEIDSIPAHLFSYDVKITSGGTRGFVSNTGPGSVTVMNLITREPIGDIAVGDNPEGLAIAADDSVLYAANADSDRISVIDVDTLAVFDTWPVYAGPDTHIGASPVALAVDQAGERLYAACSGTNEIAVFDTQTGDVLGRIPTGWYATNLRLDEDAGVLYYTSGKGYGSYGMGLYSNWRSTVHALDIPDAGELAELSAHHDEALNWAKNFYNLTGFESPIPFEHGQPSDQIKHVIFILKENKTFDQVFGDLEGAERDPNLLEFGWDNTPNHHTLAETFAVSDNLYVEGDTSVLGHLWGTFGILNDHTEKAFITGDNYPLPDIDPATRTPNGTIFERLLQAGIEFRAYGQIIGFISDFHRYLPYIDLKYGFWNMGVSDEVKADEIIREWELGIFPPFIYISLPNDHTYGSRSGAPTPQFLLGDNDAGLGKLIDWLSHSEHWADTAVFVIEDDPQSGADHVDPHRTVNLVISSWVKRGTISNVLYSMTSLWHTIELILGLPPSSKYSEYAAAMYDCFTMDQDLTPYDAIPNPIPPAENAKGLPFQDYCDTADFSAPDQVGRMGEVLWAMLKPGVPFPYDQSLSGAEDEDESEEAREYVEAVEKARAYAAAQGLEFDTLPRFKPAP
jgi:YVTN family beta-propeller protein